MFNSGIFIAFSLKRLLSFNVFPQIIMVSKHGNKLTISFYISPLIINTLILWLISSAIIWPSFPDSFILISSTFSSFINDLILIKYKKSSFYKSWFFGNFKSSVEITHFSNFLIKLLPYKNIKLSRDTSSFADKFSRVIL